MADLPRAQPLSPMRPRPAALRPTRSYTRSTVRPWSGRSFIFRASVYRHAVFGWVLRIIAWRALLAPDH